MSKGEITMAVLILEGIEGSNPLGFLAAIGTLKILNDKWPGLVRLKWVKSSGYRPVLSFPDFDGNPSHEESRTRIAQAVAETLGIPVPEPPLGSIGEVNRAFKSFQAALQAHENGEKVLDKRRKELMREGRRQRLRSEALRKWVGEQISDLQADVLEWREELQKKRKSWLRELRKIVPSEELKLGKTLSIKPAEYRDALLFALGSCSGWQERRQLDLLAAFATESVTKAEKVETTAFCFVSGAGHQYFLETVGKLMRLVDADRIQRCLFHPWDFSDEQLSLRWAPTEDRRYALMWDDPSGQVARTVWAASLLGYNALRLFPVFDVGGKSVTTGFSRFGKGYFFTWPLWEGFVDTATLGSLLSLNEFRQPEPDLGQLAGMGIFEVFRCERLKIEKFTNFATPFPAGSGGEAGM